MNTDNPHCQISPTEIAGLLGVELAGNAQAVVDCFHLVEKFFKGERPKTLSWFRALNPMLGDVAPLDMIQQGRADRLRRFIDSQLAHWA